MDLNEIKSIIKIDGGKFIIVENDKPSLVVISFEDYKKHLQKTEASQNDQSQSLFEDTQDAALSSIAPAGAKEEAKEEAPAGTDKEKKDDELTIDDLPL